MAPKIMWVGLGNMGRGMCTNLVNKGSLTQPLILYNRTRKRSDTLAAKLPQGKTEVVDSLEAGLAKADIIFSCLTNDAAVKETFEAMLKTDVQGKLFVDCSTIAPETTEGIAQDVLAKGAEYVACPVFGPPAAADAGQLIFVPAGPKTSIDKLRPFFKGVMGKSEIPFDDKPYGTSLKLKLIGNTLVFNMVTIMGESFTLAEKSDVGVGPLKQFIDSFVGGPYSAYANRMLEGTYWKMEEPLMSADNSRKDAGHAMALAQSVGVDLKLTAAADSYMQDVAEHAGGAKGDLAGIYGAARKKAGLKYENDA